MMRRAAFVLWAAVALSRAVSGQQTTRLSPGVAAQGHIEPQTRVLFAFNDSPGDAVLIRLLSLSQDYSLVFTLTPNSGSVPQPINRRSYSIPSSIPGYPPSTSYGPDVTGVTYGGEYDLTGGGQGNYTITVYSQNQVAGDFLLVYTSLKGKCLPNQPCPVVPLNCGVPAVNQQIGSPPPPPVSPPQPAAPWLQLNSYQFQANPGDMLSVRVAKYASQTMPLPYGFNVGVFAYDSSGNIIYLNQATSQVAAVQTSSGVATKLDLPAPADGLINIVVFDLSNQTGNYGISVSTLNHPCSSKSLTCGSASQGNLAGPLAIDSYKASVSSGATISIRTASTDAASSLVPVVEVYDPTGSPVTSIQSLSTATFKTTAQGDYTVLVEGGPNYTQTGGYAIAFARLDVPCNAGGSTLQALSCASVVDGSLYGALQTNSYSVAAQANDAFLIRLEQTSPNSAFRPRVDVYNPQGSPILAFNTNSLDHRSFTATGDGSYTITVSDSSPGGGQTGTYSLSLLRLNRPCNAGAIGCGALTAGNFSRPLASSVYTYTAAAGESFSLRMLDYTGALQPDLEVYDALGNPVGQSTSGNVTGVDVVQPAAGVYTVVGMDAGVRQAGGPFGIELLRTKNACAAAPPQGQTVTGVVNGAQPFTSYSIQATDGDALLVRSSSVTPGFAAQMDLYDPSGVHLDSGSTFALSRKVSATGTYTVIVGASAPLSTGGYALSWQLLNKPAATSALQCGGSTTASLSAANEFRYYLAGANAGDLMRLVFTKISDNFFPQIELFDPTGAKLPTTSDISVKAASGGAYLVVVSPSTAASETGSFTVAFQRPNNPCSPTTLACGQSTLRQVAIPGQLDTFVFAATRGGQADIKLAPRSGSYSPYTELYDASGNRLATSTGSLVYVIRSDGTYTLLVRDRSGVNLGSYRASFQDDYDPCSVTDTEPPVVTLLKPTGGEVIAGNTTYRIQWQSDDNVAVASHDIALSTDGGQTFASAIAAGLAGTTQTFNWFVPPDIAPSRTAVIRVTATDGAGNAQSALSGLISLIGSGFTANSTAAFTYDSLNRLTQAVLGDGRTIAYTWDAAGNLVAITVTGQ
jgi:YD repeat-containing protein